MLLHQLIIVFAECFTIFTEIICIIIIIIYNVIIIRNPESWNPESRRALRFYLFFFFLKKKKKKKTENRFLLSFLFYRGSLIKILF